MNSKAIYLPPDELDPLPADEDNEDRNMPALPLAEFWFRSKNLSGKKSLISQSVVFNKYSHPTLNTDW
jgi:hypothetical protein